VNAAVSGRQAGAGAAPSTSATKRPGYIACVLALVPRPHADRIVCAVLRWGLLSWQGPSCPDGALLTFCTRGFWQGTFPHKRIWHNYLTRVRARPHRMLQRWTFGVWAQRPSLGPRHGQHARCQGSSTGGATGGGHRPRACLCSGGGGGVTGKGDSRGSRPVARTRTLHRAARTLHRAAHASARGGGGRV
jgi:hypothetical protein